MFKCLHGFVPRYLVELCVPVADVTGRRNLRSATRGLLNFLRYNMTSYGRRAFSYAGPHASNSLHARTFARNHINRTFQALSKNVFIRADIALSALETFLLNGLYKFTYLLTYLLYLLAVAHTWNGLPHPVTSASSLPVFRTRLKTELFSLSFQ